MTDIVRLMAMTPVQLESLLFHCELDLIGKNFLYSRLFTFLQNALPRIAVFRLTEVEQDCEILQRIEKPLTSRI